MKLHAIGAVLFLAACAPTDAEQSEAPSVDPETTDPESTETEALWDASVGAVIADVGWDSIPAIDLPEDNASFASEAEDPSSWNVWTQANNAGMLASFFGTDLHGPVSQLRIPISYAADIADGVEALDPSVTCVGGTSLDAWDTIDAPFYGAIDNGLATDRRLACASSLSGMTVVYGVETLANGTKVHRFVAYDDYSATNTELPLERGPRVRIWSVYSVTVADDGYGDAWVDLGFAHATAYSGPDDVFGNDDDQTFRSRTSDIGLASEIVDDLGNPTGEYQIVGDFLVAREGRSLWNGVVQSNVETIHGRGGFRQGDDFLFRIESDMLPEATGPYCLLASDAALPSEQDGVVCAPQETGLPWGAAVAPFALSRAIDADFMNVVLYDGQDGDMVNEDGSDFVQPVF